jgi:hypothetical protein
MIYYKNIAKCIICEKRIRIEWNICFEIHTQDRFFNKIRNKIRQPKYVKIWRYDWHLVWMSFGCLRSFNVRSRCPSFEMSHEIKIFFLSFLRFCCNIFRKLIFENFFTSVEDCLLLSDSKMLDFEILDYSNSF